VRGLLSGAIATRVSDAFVLPNGRSAGIDLVDSAVGEGALSCDGETCRANGVTSAWLKRMKLDAGAPAAQLPPTAVPQINVAESPLTRLATGKYPFLEPHHVEAGERVRRLVEKAQLQPRVTMTYSASRSAGHGLNKNDISDMAADARRAVAEIHRVLPRDCAGVVLDVCGFLKGLQEVEWERGWPRRSAKLVLRIGLEQLALHYGLSAAAVGELSARRRAWIGEGARPTSWD
jgi:hypothetical protein